MLTAEHIRVTLGGKPIVDDVSLHVAAGDWLMLLGPNGAGKTTLLHAISCALLSAGEIRLNGEDVRAMPPKVRAQKIGVLSQHSDMSAAFTVAQVVAMGRYSHRRGVFGADEPDLSQRVADALAQVGMTELRDRSMLTLSGGERQRAFLAQVLCQDPQILLLDEPANHLDLVYQKQLFELTDHWCKKPGRAVISVVHDLSLARAFGTQALLMDAGRCIAQGAPSEVLDDDNLNRVWQMDVRAWRDRLYQAWEA